jgi:hypothetical protein
MVEFFEEGRGIECGNRTSILSSDRVPYTAVEVSGMMHQPSLSSRTP